MIAIHRGGLADGAEVEHHFDRGALTEEGLEIVGMHHAGRRMAGEVAPFSLAAQRVRDYGFMSAPGQLGMQVGADEAGTASYQDHEHVLYEVPGDAKVA